MAPKTKKVKYELFTKDGRIRSRCGVRNSKRLITTAEACRVEKTPKGKILRCETKDCKSDTFRRVPKWFSMRYSPEGYKAKVALLRRQYYEKRKKGSKKSTPKKKSASKGGVLTKAQKGKLIDLVKKIKIEK